MNNENVLKELEEMKNIRFKITSKMSSLLLETILMEQVLQLKNLNKLKYVLFYQHFEDLKDEFNKELEKHNKEQIDRYNELVKKIGEK